MDWTDNTTPALEAVCRVCHCESEPDRPLFYPCSCSGSIKYVHEDCLMEWLKVSEKKSCELCGDTFHFKGIYADGAPKRLSVYELLTELLSSINQNMSSRIVRIGKILVWVGFIPLCCFMALKVAVAIAVHKDNALKLMQSTSWSFIPTSSGAMLMYWGKGVMITSVVLALLGVIAAACILLRKELVRVRMQPLLEHALPVGARDIHIPNHNPLDHNPHELANPVELLPMDLGGAPPANHLPLRPPIDTGYTPITCPEDNAADQMFVDTDEAAGSDSINTLEQSSSFTSPFTVASVKSCSQGLLDNSSLLKRVLSDRHKLRLKKDRALKRLCMEGPSQGATDAGADTMHTQLATSTSTETTVTTAASCAGASSGVDGSTPVGVGDGIRQDEAHPTNGNDFNEVHNHIPEAEDLAAHAPHFGHHLAEHIDAADADNPLLINLFQEPVHAGRGQGANPHAQLNGGGVRRLVEGFPVKYGLLLAVVLSTAIFVGVLVPVTIGHSVLGTPFLVWITKRKLVLIPLMLCWVLCIVVFQWYDSLVQLYGDTSQLQKLLLEHQSDLGLQFMKLPSDGPGSGYMPLKEVIVLGIVAYIEFYIGVFIVVVVVASVFLFWLVRAYGDSNEERKRLRLERAHRFEQFPQPVDAQEPIWAPVAAALALGNAAEVDDELDPEVNVPIYTAIYNAYVPVVRRRLGNLWISAYHATRIIFLMTIDGVVLPLAFACAMDTVTFKTTNTSLEFRLQMLNEFPVICCLLYWVIGLIFSLHVAYCMYCIRTNVKKELLDKYFPSAEEMFAEDEAGLMILVFETSWITSIQRILVHTCVCIAYMLFGVLLPVKIGHVFLMLVPPLQLQFEEINFDAQIPVEIIFYHVVLPLVFHVLQYRANMQAFIGGYIRNATILLNLDHVYFVHHLEPMEVAGNGDNEVQNEWNMNDMTGARHPAPAGHRLAKCLVLVSGGCVTISVVSSYLLHLPLVVGRTALHFARIQPLANDLYHYGAGVLIIWGGFVICKAVVGRAVAAIGPILPDDTLVENATLHRVKALVRIAVKMCMVVAHGFMTIAQWACVILVGCGLIPFLLGITAEILVLSPLRSGLVPETSVPPVLQCWAFGAVVISAYTRMVLLPLRNNAQPTAFQRNLQLHWNQGLERMDVLGIFRNIYAPLLLTLLDIALIPYFIARLVGFWYHHCYGREGNGGYHYGPESQVSMPASSLSSYERSLHQAIGDSDALYSIHTQGSSFNYYVQSLLVRFAALTVLIVILVMWLAHAAYSYAIQFHNKLRDSKYLLGTRLTNKT